MKKSLIAAMAVCSAIAMSAGAQSVLDQQLGGGKPEAKPAEATRIPDETRATVPSPPPKPDGDRATAAPAGGDDIISPGAVRKVDDSDLINKLTQPEGQKAANPVKQQMTDMIERMGTSQKRLTDKDPGEVTQETQRRILADLDVLIEYARQQQQSGPSQNDPNQQQQQGQQRQQNSGQGQQQNQGGSTAARDSFLPGGSPEKAQPGEDIHSHTPDEWGRLGARDRDLISHGANEQYLSSYKDMIERYYQALAEIGKNRNNR